MKKPSNAFVLIRNMTMSEKRYFKLFSERHTVGEQNKYVILFNLLDELGQEDDTILKKEFNRLHLNTDFISADKNYLYQLLLKSLNDFHAGKTHNLKAKELLLAIEVLFQKGLYAECLKLTERAEKTALECENFSLMIDVLNWKKKCAGYSLGLAKAAEVNKRIDHYIFLLNNHKQFTDLYYQSNLLQSGTEKVSRKEMLKKFNELMKNPLLKQERNVPSFSSRIYFHLIWSNFFHVTENRAGEKEHLLKLGSMMNQSLTYAPENPLDYVSIYGRILSILKFYDEKTLLGEADTLNAFAQKVSIRREEVEKRVFVHINTSLLEFLLMNARYSEAEQKTREISRNLSKSDLAMEPYHLIYFHYLHAICSTFSGKFSEALRHINKVLNEFDSGEREQVHLRVQILNAVVHYEMGNMPLVKAQIQQIKKQKNSNYLLLPEKELIEKLLMLCQLEEKNIKVETTVWRELAERFEKSKSKTRISLNGLINNYSAWFRARAQRKLVTD